MSFLLRSDPPQIHPLNADQIGPTQEERDFVPLRRGTEDGLNVVLVESSEDGAKLTW